MPSSGNLERPVFRFASTAASFEEEQQELLDGRLKVVFLLGFAIALAVHFFYAGIVEFHPQVETPLNAWIASIYDLFLFSIGLAAATLFVHRWSLKQLLVVDYMVLTFNIFVMLFIAVVFDGNEIPAFGLALILFIHAAFIPVPIVSQVGLALTATLGFAGMAALGYAVVPGVLEFWQANGGAIGFETFLLEGTFQVAVLAVVSVFITKALYHLRRSLHKAKRFGNYVVKRELGEGGMGQVYVAQHALMCRPAAVKVMKSAPGEGPAALARFEREVQLSSTLTHPNTIMIYDYGRSSADTFYYAMEYLEGLDLHALVDRLGPLHPERATFILTQVCGSLAEAHDAGIMHRDIKPSNIFLTRRGGIYDFVKVLDFGLAKQIGQEEAAPITKTGLVFGTPRYMSPEVASGSGEVDGRGDLYCLGAVAFWMLTGRPPFESRSCVEAIVDHVKTAPKPPSELCELPIPAELDAVVLRCLEKRPEDRFQSAVEVVDALGSIPFAEPWTQARAREWWDLHLPELAQRPAAITTLEEITDKPVLPAL